MIDEIVNGYQVLSDGRMVWVNSPQGMSVGRFSKMGIDIHTADTTGCLDCTAGPCGLEDWERFVTGVHRYYGVVVDAAHRPNYLSA